MTAHTNEFTDVVKNGIQAGDFSRAEALQESESSFRQVVGKAPMILFASALALLLAPSSPAATATVPEGKAVTMSVAASGTAPFSYQWYKNGAVINGATSASLALASATVNDSANYSAVVRNAAGSTVSDVAVLTVNPVVITPPPPPAPTGVSDSGFESLRVGANTFYAFQYAPSLAGWTFSGYAGIAGNNSGFTSGNPASPEGTQVAFVQMQGSATVRTTLTSGRYVLSAMVANRANFGGLQTVLVLVDGVQVGRFSGGTAYTLASTNVFNVADGAHDISFAGLSAADATLFIDQIRITAAQAGISVVSSGFESPDVGANDFWAFRYNPPVVAGTQPWTFQGYSGVTGNSSGFTASNPQAPEGKQVAFIQMNTGVMSQTLTVATAGSYQLTVLAAQRGNYNQSEQQVMVYLDNTLIGSIVPHSTFYQSFTLPFTATAGSHQLIFKGTATNDSTVFLDRVTVQQPGT